MNKDGQQTLAIEQEARPGSEQPARLSSERGPHFSSKRSPQLSVELHVEELVLNGFSSVDSQSIGEALERELVRLLSEGGVPEAIAGEFQTDFLEGGSLQLLPSTPAEVIGARIAHALYGGLSR